MKIDDTVNAGASRPVVEGFPTSDEPPGRVSAAEVLVRLARAADLFRGHDGETGFATVAVGGHRETLAIRSRGFKQWLAGRFYVTEGKPATAQAMTDALTTIEAQARFGVATHRVHVRVAPGADGAAIYIDLANEAREVVEVTPAGWRILNDAPVKFRRPRAVQALPRPLHGGSADLLRQYVNVRDHVQWMLLLGWIVTAFRPGGPYPVLALGGEHGAAKSTTAEVLRRLIDPNGAMLRAEPREGRDLVIAANNGWVIALDNLSELRPWLSDALCRVSTGGGFSTRELYSNDEEVIFEGQRPIILNGIESVVVRPDLLDRAILLDLPSISEDKRRPASALWRAFERDQPRILGALLDAVAVALSREARVHPPRLPRMADAAIWVTAAAPAFGWAEDAFITAYDGNREGAHDIALDAAAIGPGVRALAEVGEWKGTAAALLEKLTKETDDATRRGKEWPATARALAGALRRLAPTLRALGVEVEFEREATAARRRFIIVRKDRGRDRPHRPYRPDGAEDGHLGVDGHADGVDGRGRRPSSPNPASQRDLDGMDGVDDVAPVSSDSDEEVTL